MKDLPIQIRVNSKVFSASLHDNPTSRALLELMPLTLNMIELNGNEKYALLPKGLPVNSIKPKTIHAGDLMLYGEQTLVLFYKTFSSSYSYTPVGRIVDVSGLSVSLGSGSALVTFEKQ